MNLLSIIWQIVLIAVLLGFWPTLWFIYRLWENRDTSKLDTYVAEWFPAIVWPWLGCVFVFFAIFLGLVFFR